MKKEKQGFLFCFIRGIIKKVSKKPKIINKNSSLPKQAIYISNHSAANGPLKLNLFFPVKVVFWGVHNMLEGYKIRRRYLIDVFYDQKLHYGKWKSWLIGTLFAIISGYIYDNASVIPTYTDSRFLLTIRKSISTLESGKNILIFPEDSSDGYHDILQKYYKGFAVLSEMYYKKTKIDLPVYPVYFSKKKRKMIIGTPLYVNELLQSGKSHDMIAELALHITNTYALEI